MATGDKLVNLDELKLVYDKLHVPSVQVQIPTGQWSGSSTRTYTVNATNVTADTIIDWAMDSSINYLKADLTVTPGSGTIQFSTTAIPAGTINVTLFFPGVNGEVVIQTLADVYSKSQVDQKISQSTAYSVENLNIDSSVATANGFRILRYGRLRIITGSITPAVSQGSWLQLCTLAATDRPTTQIEAPLFGYGATDSAEMVLRTNGILFANLHAGTSTTVGLKVNMSYIAV